MFPGFSLKRGNVFLSCCYQNDYFQKAKESTLVTGVAKWHAQEEVCKNPRRLLMSNVIWRFSDLSIQHSLN